MFPSGNFFGFDNNGQFTQQQINMSQTQGQPLVSNQISQISQMQMPLSQANFTQCYPANIQVPQMQMQSGQLTTVPTYANQQNVSPPNQEQHIQQMQPYNSQQIVRMISTSDEELENINKDNPWQLVRSVKRKKTIRNVQTTTDNDIHTSNRYSTLTNIEPEKSTNEDKSNENKPNERTPKPPPIFVYDVKDYPSMITKLNDILEEEQYDTKTMADNTVKINTKTPEAYRSLARFMKENNIIHHTYQPKEDRSYRVVIKHLHHSTDISLIKNELQSLGHKIRNVINIKQRQTKEPLNMFFVDLEPAKNNKDVYRIRGLQNRIIVIEPPRGDKNIAQCTRCQLYGHTKSYCNRPYVCVKCGGPHDTKTCKKSNQTPATCALCGGPHPANYRGCEYYHKFYKNNNRMKTNTPQQQTQKFIPPNQTQTPNVLQQPTYSNVLQGPRNVPQNKEEDVSKLLTRFLEEFKHMFNQLIQQNSTVLNMLTMLISKIH